MRTITFVIFYSVVITIYLLINYYIFIRGWQALPSDSRSRTIYLVVFLVLSLSYIAGRILEKFWQGPPVNLLLWTGSFWLGAMLYFVLILLAIDLVRLINLVIPVIPAGWLENAGRIKFVLFTGSVVAVFLLVIAAHVNTWYPRVTTVEIGLEGKNSRMKSVNMVMVSDIHLGSLTPKNRIGKMVDKINSLNPDIIVMAGDMLDEDVGPVIQRDLGSTLMNLSAPLGIYGITGNHEYIGGVGEAARYLTDHGIELIRDSVIRINDSFYLAGREDLSIETFAGKKRKSVDDLLKLAGDDLPVILMDHQPLNLDKSAAAGADLQLSGHTHHGQLWPLNFITRAIFSISRGYGEVNGMQVYVSNGIGTWGPPMRVGSRPEIVYLKINFK